MTIMIAVATALALQSPAGFEGAWRGTLDIGAAELRLEIHLENTDGIWAGHMVSFDQHGARVPASAVEIDGTQLVFDMSLAGATYSGTLGTDQRIEGVFSQAGQSFDLDLERGSHADTTAALPDENPHDQAIEIDNAGIRLAGSLRVPAAAQPVPGVVIISGSGPQDRDMTVGPHQMFRTLADALENAGIASLRLDDRGVGGSAAVEPIHPSHIASDMAAALETLRQSAGVDGQCVGFIGHSEGGSHAFLAAADAQPAFILTLAGMFTTMADTLIEQADVMARAADADETAIAAQRSLQDAVMEAMRSATPGEAGPAIVEALTELDLPDAVAQQQAAIWGSAYAQNALDLDISAQLADFDGPLHALFGGLDVQVPPQSALDRLAATRHGQPTTTDVLPEHNHLFQRVPTAMPLAYDTADHAISDEALEAIIRALQSMAQSACAR